MGPLTRLLGGSGRLPDRLRAAITGEQVAVLAEGLPGSVTYRETRAPEPGSAPHREHTQHGERGERGKHTQHGERGGRSESVTGAIAVTDRTLLVWAGGVTHVDVRHHDPLRRAGVSLSADRPGQILIRYVAGREHVRPAAGRGKTAGPGQTIEVRLRTPQAPAIARAYRDLAAR